MEENKELLDGELEEEEIFWDPEAMTVVAADGAELNELAQRTILKADSYLGGSGALALVSVCVLVLFDALPEGEDLSDALCGLLSEVNRLMEDTLTQQPDFSKYRLDDGMLAVEMGSGMMCLHDPADPGMELDENGEPTLACALAMRQEILDACEGDTAMAVCICHRNSEF